ncbi:zinc finger CCCH domain-containing protein 15-like [Ipomoea triloba]|uniref:zinc finger CCCH domain-containing protein 15-like n=1 Tax=Ipomoea triloba TaxID=35885 RepID=UPI00125DA503|nr:zinc finger CCCH domain-containing protein 15-like [Ipomoea triloba]XP_031100212.1 zinc finger CCCH domain-containing protein 15-like [Ipomoea triloba]XP_031100213.1 zinc finger CCCH domain-containing protein 15-like [Ipomoea triloba]
MEYDLLSSPSFLSQASNASFDFNSLYNSIMIPPNSLHIGESSSGGESQALEATTSGIPHSQLLLDQQYHRDLMDRHNAVLAHLRETAKQAQALRQENINLKMANLDLNNRLTLLLKASSDYAAKFGAPSKFGMRRKSVPVGDDESTSQGQLWEDMGATTSSGDCHESPTSVMDSGRVERNNVDRVLLPKSISVRSSGYLKTAQAGGSRPENRSKASHTAQRVYLKGAKKEEQPLELEVYNQGMFKTELCNKWQETGACPYGDNCQFAHGLEELRPVLRHPRYKTEVCRMVLNGDPCPYGHRCHFRHSLTDQEKLIRALNSRSLNSSLSS